MSLVSITKRRTEPTLEIVDYDINSCSLAQLKVYVGGISRVSKGDDTGKGAWFSYGTPAEKCNVGSKLRGRRGSTCEKCYAYKRGNYRFNSVVESQYRKLESIKRKHWVAAMTRLISHYSPDYFRWHDSGDIVDLTHLIKIVQVARNLPGTKFWLPTRETAVLREYRAQFGALPSNLCARLSAWDVNSAPPHFRDLLDLPTSTVHTEPDAYPREHGAIECKAYTRDGCGNCRACWSPKVSNVSYRAH